MGPVTPTITSGWPASKPYSVPEMPIDSSTSRTPMLCAVRSVKKKPKVMAGSRLAKNINSVAESTWCRRARGPHPRASACCLACARAPSVSWRERERERGRERARFKRGTRDVPLRFGPRTGRPGTAVPVRQCRGARLTTTRCARSGCGRCSALRRPRTPSRVLPPVFGGVRE